MYTSNLCMCIFENVFLHGLNMYIHTEKSTKRYIFKDVTQSWQIVLFFHGVWLHSLSMYAHVWTHSRGMLYLWLRMSRRSPWGLLLFRQSNKFTLTVTVTVTVIVTVTVTVTVRNLTMAKTGNNNDCALGSFCVLPFFYESKIGDFGTHY